MIMVPKKVYLVGATQLVSEIGHEFIYEDPGRMLQCDYFVGVDNMPSARILVNFCLGFFLGMRRKCLVVSCQEDAYHAWCAQGSHPGMWLKAAKSIEEAQTAIREFLPKHYDTYAAYLKSVDWAQKREAALTRAENRCQVCYDVHRLECHHRTYSRVGRERDADLVVLCDECHELYHRRERVRPAPEV